MFVNFKSVDHFLKLIIIPFHANSRVTNIKGKLQISLLVRKASRKPKGFYEMKEKIHDKRIFQRQTTPHTGS